MNFLIIIRVALRSLRRTLLRSSLTALGIIIGVAAVIAMVSIGNGARAHMASIFASMDANRITLSAMMPRTEGMMRFGMRIPPGDGIQIEDYEAIRKEITGITAITPLVSTNTGAVLAQGRRIMAEVLGINVSGFDLFARRIVSGGSFGESDVANAGTVCVITSFLAEELFPGQEAVGKLIRIDNAPFLVIGVMEDSNDMRSRAQGGDVTIYVPYTSVLRRLDRNANINIVLKAANPGHIPYLQQALSDVMERNRGKRRAEFMTGNMAEMIERFNEQSRTMTLLLGAIGGISLLVGGIGIMNIMLVSVTERTREIGIRLAIGTRGRDVLRQFLLEAMILSVLGGGIGIVLGVSAAYAVRQFSGLPTDVTIGSIVAAFVCSAGIGIFFGYYPARHAARLDPIDALRAD